MQFKDQGIILTKKPLKEKDSIIEIFSQNHGLYAGVLKQYSKKNGDNLMPGNLVTFTWYSRLEEHLGTIKAENIKSHAASLMLNKIKLHAFHSIISLIKISFHEREKHDRFFLNFMNFMNELGQGFCFRNYLNFELDILKEAGYQLNLERCVVTNECEDLIFVSPKSGQAVSGKAGADYATKLLKLPKFLTQQTKLDLKQLKQSLALTTYFFEKYMLINKPMPLAREIFMQSMANSLD